MPDPTRPAALGGGDRAALVPTSAPGVYLQTAQFQAVAACVEQRFQELSGTLHDRILGAPVIMLKNLELSAYVERFPQLLATVLPRIARAGEAEVDLALTPAACLHLYPIVAAGAPIEPEGLTVAIACTCHRTEARYELTRLRTFNMAELVFFGRPTQVSRFLNTLLRSVRAWLAELGLEPIERAANDPFYGRGADLMARHQRDLQSKLEVTFPVGAQAEVACFSFNNHAEFFSQRWGIALVEGPWAHSACVGVGLERLTLALIDRYGDRPFEWPSAVRDALSVRMA